MKLRPVSNPAFWLNPIIFFVFTVMAVALCAWGIPDTDYLLDWRTAKHFNGQDLGITALAVCAFVIGAIGRQVTEKPQRNSAPLLSSITLENLPWLTIYRLFLVSYALTMLGYILWFIICIKNGLSLSLIIDLLKGASGTSTITTEIGRDSSISGLTTAVQFGMAAVLLGTLIACRFGWRKVRVPLILLLALTMVRSFIFSERLATLELVIPAGLLYLRVKFISSPSRRARRTLIFLPLVAVLSVATLFSVTEYFRSWVNFYAEQGAESSFLRQNSMRLIGYYATALNNGALLYHQSEARLPFYTVQFLWKFPVIRDLPAVQNLADNCVEEFESLLEAEANPEFNNTSGIFVTFYDYGIIGAAVLWMATGYVSVMLYRAFLRGTIGGLLLYPFFFLGLMEITRIFYWTDSRSFPTWMLLFVVVAIVVNHRKRQLAGAFTWMPAAAQG